MQDTERDFERLKYYFWTYLGWQERVKVLASLEVLPGTITQPLPQTLEHLALRAAQQKGKLRELWDMIMAYVPPEELSPRREAANGEDRKTGGTPVLQLKGTTMGDDIATILEEAVAGHFADNADWRRLGLRVRVRIHRAIEAAARVVTDHVTDHVTDLSSRDRVLEQFQAVLEAKLGELQGDVAGEEVGTDSVVGIGVVLAILIPLLIQLIPVLVDLIIKWINERDLQAGKQILS